MTPAPAKHRLRFRFSLRALLVTVLLAAVGLAILRRNLRLAARQKDAVEALEKSGFYCRYDYGRDAKGEPLDAPEMPAWLISLFGTDCFYNVAFISKYDVTNTDELWRLRDFPHLEDFSAHDWPSGDAVAANLSGLRDLKSLQLSNCGVNDAALSTCGACSVSKN